MNAVKKKNNKKWKEMKMAFVFQYAYCQKCDFKTNEKIDHCPNDGTWTALHYGPDEMENDANSG